MILDIKCENKQDWYDTFYQSYTYNWNLERNSRKDCNFAVYELYGQCKKKIHNCCQNVLKSIETKPIYTAGNRHKQNSRFCKEIREDSFRFWWRRVHEDASQGMYMSLAFLLLEYCKIRECYAVANAFTIRNMHSLLLYMKCSSRKINRPTKNMTKIVTLLHF